MLSRREWMSVVGQAAVVTAIGRRAAASAASAAPTFCLFSKHLPDVGWDDLAAAVREAGYDGVDLTVRRKVTWLPNAPPTICHARSRQSRRAGGKCR